MSPLLVSCQLGPILSRVYISSHLLPQEPFPDHASLCPTAKLWLPRNSQISDQFCGSPCSSLEFQGRLVLRPAPEQYYLGPVLQSIHLFCSCCLYQLSCRVAESLSLSSTVTMTYTVLCRQLNAHPLFVK